MYPINPEVISEERDIFIINPFDLQLENDSWYRAEHLELASVPPGAIPNLEPYMAPRHVIAGGGFLIKHTDPEPEILLILRKGLWDIPKGKLDKGESYQQCAVREVQEEVGITRVEAVQSLGCTWHCYERKGRFCVKQTYWYEMVTPEETFTPQAEEDIEDVAWVAWSKAREILGFPVLSLHMKYTEGQIFR